MNSLGIYIFCCLCTVSDDDSWFNDKNMSKHTIPGQSLKSVFTL